MVNFLILHTPHPTPHTPHLRSLLKTYPYQLLPTPYSLLPTQGYFILKMRLSVSSPNLHRRSAWAIFEK
ncbi:hypothetical protein [Moorena sp. SIO3I6]|uniref:hypothetical protein n=1 Tax=Moorena sp. SIO3I6 TaxID=2607831 RepID=UPI0013FB0275|nr:hypothetical protein [Moorena sp. SIO3I6]NEP22739.1 hypothetical protein [Moorena sp. SIO3I6]